MFSELEQIDRREARTNLVRQLEGVVRGDVVVQSFSGPLRISFLENQRSNRAFTADAISRIDTWATTNNIDVTYSATSELMQAAVIHEGRAGSPAFVLGNLFLLLRLARQADPFNVTTSSAR